MHTKRNTGILALFVALSLLIPACASGQRILDLLATPTFTPTLTPTSTPTQTPTLTPSVTPTVTPSPTYTPMPLATGQWSGQADGWKPPLTVSLTIVAENGAYKVTKLKIFIPEINLYHFLSSLVHTTCTVKIESLAVVDGGIVFPDGLLAQQGRVFDGQFTSATAVTGSIYNGWSCDGITVNLGSSAFPDNSTVTWHAKASRP